MSITLEPGRLALRKPELGPMLIVTVERLVMGGLVFVCGEGHSRNASDFLPILRPGDVVPAGSLLLNAALPDAAPLEMQRGGLLWSDQMEGRAWHGHLVALLRYGPEEDA